MILKKSEVTRTELMLHGRGDGTSAQGYFYTTRVAINYQLNVHSF